MTDGAPNSSAKMYLSGSLGVIFSRIVGMLAGVISLWFLTCLLSTADFASYTFAMSLVYVLGFVSGFGLERVMLLKIGPITPKPGVLFGGLLVRRITVRVALSSLVAVGLAVLVLLTFPILSANNNLLGWFVALMPIVPAVALMSVLIAWLQANHIVGRPQSLHGQVDALRCFGFAGAYVMGLGAAAIAFAAIVAAIIPPAVMARRSVPKAAAKPGTFTLSDVLDGLNFFGLKLAYIGFLHADIIIVGILAPPEVVAPYVVASRFALLLEAGQQIFASAYAPRVRRHSELGTADVARREYQTARVLGFLLSGGAAMGLFFIGQPLLAAFGGYDGAYDVLLLMCAGQLILVGAGLHSVHLSMTGHLKVTMFAQLAGLGVFMVLMLGLIPAYGGIGAAMSFVIAQTFLAVVGLWILWQRCSIWPFRPLLLLSYLLAPASLILAAMAPSLHLLGGTILCCAIALTIWSARGLLSSVITDIKAQVFQQKT